MAVYCSHIPLTFVHIPKTAGSAVSNWLKEHASGTDFMPTSFGAKHWDFSMINRQMVKRDIPAGRVVVVVRNPWDRLVSTWAYYRRRNASWVSEDFAEFVMNTTWGTAKRPQTDFYPWKKTLILRFENLATDFSKLQQLCNCFASLDIVNRSDHQHYTEYYDSTTREEVRIRHASDITTLGYTYE